MSLRIGQRPGKTPGAPNAAFSQPVPNAGAGADCNHAQAAWTGSGERKAVLAEPQATVPRTT